MVTGLYKIYLASNRATEILFQNIPAQSLKIRPNT